ncbi:MAG: hypothetical protein LBG27_06815 [Spirochaetaceae bacterium]|jgi:hypothetical protein|nr:hypothetical protein [Spirochaetaceae bacterium]
MTGLNRIVSEEGLEDVKELGQGSTVTETNIHYPANNSLVYDRVKESEKTPEPGVTDGGHAGGANIKPAKEKVIVNIMFNKTAGSMVNVCTSEKKKQLKELPG